MATRGPLRSAVAVVFLPFRFPLLLHFSVKWQISGGQFVLTFEA